MKKLSIVLLVLGIALASVAGFYTGHILDAIVFNPL